MPTLRTLTEYHKPATLDEALKLLRRKRVKTVPLAGGTSLVPEAAADVQAVVDLGALDLAFVRETSEVSVERPKVDEGRRNFGSLEMGAMTRLQTLVDHEAVRAYADGLLPAAILDSASRNTREAATLAGSIVAAPGNSPLFTALLALDAHLTVRGARTRAGDVALPYWTPQPRSLILSITLPTLPDNVHAAYEKIARTPADQPIVCVAARATAARAGGDPAQLRDIRLALGGVAEKPIVITRPAGSIEELAQLAVSTVTPADDYFATAAYRREMIGVLVKRVLSHLLRQPQ